MMAPRERQKPSENVNVKVKSSARRRRSDSSTLSRESDDSGARRKLSGRLSDVTTVTSNMQNDLKNWLNSPDRQEQFEKDSNSFDGNASCMGSIDQRVSDSEGPAPELHVPSSIPTCATSLPGSPPQNSAHVAVQSQDHPPSPGDDQIMSISEPEGEPSSSGSATLQLQSQHPQSLQNPSTVNEDTVDPSGNASSTSSSPTLPSEQKEQLCQAGTKKEPEKEHCQTFQKIDVVSQHSNRQQHQPPRERQQEQDQPKFSQPQQTRLGSHQKMDQQLPHCQEKQLHRTENPQNQQNPFGSQQMHTKQSFLPSQQPQNQLPQFHQQTHTGLQEMYPQLSFHTRQQPFSTNTALAMALALGMNVSTFTEFFNNSTGPTAGGSSMMQSQESEFAVNSAMTEVSSNASTASGAAPVPAPATSSMVPPPAPSPAPTPDSATIAFSTPSGNHQQPMFDNSAATANPTTLAMQILVNRINQLESQNNALNHQNNTLRDQICQLGGQLVELGSICSNSVYGSGSVHGGAYSRRMGSGNSVGSLTGGSFIIGVGANGMGNGMNQSNSNENLANAVGIRNSTSIATGSNSAAAGMAILNRKRSGSDPREGFVGNKADGLGRSDGYHFNSSRQASISLDTITSLDDTLSEENDDNCRDHPNFDVNNLFLKHQNKSRSRSDESEEVEAEYSSAVDESIQAKKMRNSRKDTEESSKRINSSAGSIDDDFNDSLTEVSYDNLQGPSDNQEINNSCHSLNDEQVSPNQRNLAASVELTNEIIEEEDESCSSGESEGSSYHSSEENVDSSEGDEKDDHFKEDLEEPESDSDSESESDEESERETEGQDVEVRKESLIPQRDIAQDLDASFSAINSFIAKKYGLHNVPVEPSINKQSGRRRSSFSVDGGPRDEQNSGVPRRRSSLSVEPGDEGVFTRRSSLERRQGNNAHKNARRNTSAEFHESLAITDSFTHGFSADSAFVDESDNNPFRQRRFTHDNSNRYVAPPPAHALTNKVDRAVPEHPLLHRKDNIPHNPHYIPRLYMNVLDESTKSLNVEDLESSVRSRDPDIPRSQVKNLIQKRQQRVQTQQQQQPGIRGLMQSFRKSPASSINAPQEKDLEQKIPLSHIECDNYTKEKPSKIRQLNKDGTVNSFSSVGLQLDSLAEDTEGSVLPEDATDSQIDIFLEKTYLLRGKPSPSDVNNSTQLDDEDHAKTGTENGNRRRSSRQSDCNSDNESEVESGDRFDANPNASNQKIMNRIRRFSTAENLDVIKSNDPVSFTLGRRKTNRYISMNQKSFMNPFGRSFMNRHNSDNKLKPISSLSKMSNNSLADLNCREEENTGEDKEHSVHVTKIVNSLSMMMNRQSLEKAMQYTRPMTNVPFELFFLLSMNTADAKNQLESGLINVGKTYLDPFIFKSAECIDRYPPRIEKDSLDPLELSAFCCPEGIKVRVLPRAAMSGAKQMGYVGKRACQYKVLVFTSENGESTHGIAITVSEEVSIASSEMGEIMDHFLMIRKRRMSVRKLCRWWRLTWDKIVKARAEALEKAKQRRGRRPSIMGRDDNGKKTGPKRRASWNALTVMFNSASSGNLLELGLIEDNDNESDDDSFPGLPLDLGKDNTSAIGSFTSRNSQNSRASSNSKFLSASLSSKTGSSLRRNKIVAKNLTSTILDYPVDDNDNDNDTNDIEISDGNSSENGFLDWGGVTHYDDDDSDDDDEYSANGLDVDFPESRVKVEPSRTEILAREAYEAMMSADAEGDVCIIEKCYVMVGGKQSEQFLHLRLLQNMINKEQEETENPTMHKSGNAGNNNLLLKTGLKFPLLRRASKEAVKDPVERMIEFRHQYLQVLLEQMRLSPEHSRANSSQNKPSNSKRKRPTTFDIELPTFSHETYIFSTALPMPQVAAHWGVASLMTRIKSSDIILVLKLLLVERSVLIIGESPHLVTACACALLELLKPYVWASNFMPLLPGEMLDFVNSPVPFLIGMTVKDEKHSLEIENDERVVDARETGLTCINLSTNTVRLTNETEIVEIIQGCPTPKTQLAMFEKRLDFLRTQSSPLRSFARFVKQGFSRSEIETIESIRRVIRTYLNGLADNIAAHPYGWSQYGKKDESGDNFDFYPSLFVDRLKQQMKLLECRLQFQEMMAYSQLFVEYVDGQRKAALCKEMVGKYIADWIYLHLKLKKLLKDKKEAETKTSLFRR